MTPTASETALRYTPPIFIGPAHSIIFFPIEYFRSLDNLCSQSCPIIRPDRWHYFQN